MNLFIFSWQLPKGEIPAVCAELRRMTEVHPHLDPGTLWYWSAGDTAFAASVHTAESVAAPRRYVWQDKNHVTLYDGIMVDRTGSFRAHRAEELATHWDQLAESLEGPFVVMRIASDPLSIELLTDPLGMEQVYYVHQGNTWLVSNSVRLLEQISNSKALDPLGVSLFLTIGWAGADRTLRRDISVIAGGQHWIWQQGGAAPLQRTYFSRSGLAQKPHKAFTWREAEQLANSFIQMCSSLSHHFGTLDCPLSGGRDSRVLAAVLIHAGIPAEYWTHGPPSGSDVPIARQIAQAFGLHHNLPTAAWAAWQVSRDLTADLIECWDDLSWRLVRRHDGLASFSYAPYMWGEPSRVDRLRVTLYGTGGEIARSYYGGGHVFRPRLTARRMLELFPQSMVRDHDGLITRHATELAGSYIQRFLEECLDEGFTPRDLPDVFYAYERVRRWACNNQRQVAAVEEPFIPFCTRPFLEAAFSISALQRYSQPIHSKLIQHLVPQLQSIPFDKPWPLQRPTLNFLKFTAQWLVRKIHHLIPLRMSHSGAKPPPRHSYDQSALLEAKCEQIREICLCQHDSLLWSFVNRALFEHLTSPTTDSTERSRRAEILFAIATMFYYEISENAAR